MKDIANYISSVIKVYCFAADCQDKKKKVPEPDVRCFKSNHSAWKFTAVLGEISIELVFHRNTLQYLIYFYH